MLKFFSLLSKTIATVFLVSNICLIHSMEKEVQAQQVPTPEFLRKLYIYILNQQRTGVPGYTFETNIRKEIMDTLEILKDPLKGLTEVYKIMWGKPNEIFSTLFSPHNIKMLAYQQHKFGRDSSYFFDETQGQEVFDTNEDPFLMAYKDKIGNNISVTTYSYFYGMIENMGPAHQAARENYIPISNFTQNVLTLKNNLLIARSDPLELSAEAIGKIAERITTQSDLRFLTFINQQSRSEYQYNRNAEGSQNTDEQIETVVLKIISNVVKQGQTVPKKIEAQPNSTSWWKMATYALGATAATAVLAGLIYKLKSASSSADLPITIKYIKEVRY